MSKVDYTQLSKEELIERIRKFELHVQQLRNVITKRQGSSESTKSPIKRIKLDENEEGNTGNGQNEVSEKKSKKKNLKSFDFSSVTMRHVALKILYLGWDFQGLAAQEDTEETIEAHLFKALKLTKLIEDRTKSNYHRVGRTDKGVSAFSQVFSIDLRSKIVNGEETLDYCKLINVTLPKGIRVIAWSPVRPDFSARFDCCKRSYRYFFPRSNLDIQKMITAAQYLVGEHDYRNFCKIDKDRTTMRRIMSVDIISNNASSSSPYDVCQLVIVGKAFLWHQIRCIVGVLILVGQGLEDPNVVEELLNLEKNPRRPQYSMAVDYPLNLYEVEYPEEEGIKWNYTTENMTSLLTDMQASWMPYSIKAEMIREMIKDIEKQTEVKSTKMTDFLILGTIRKSYTKLLDLPTCGPCD